MKKVLTIALCFVLALTTFTGCGGGDSESEEISGPMILENGKIYTVAGDDWENSAVEAIGIGEDGKIAALGTSDEVKSVMGDDVTTVDLQGKTILPGLIDAHVHAPGTATTQLYQIDLFNEFDKEGSLKAIQAFIDENPDMDAYFGTGFNMGMVDENDNPPAASWLDELNTDKPITLQSNDMHSMWLNTKAMEDIGVDKNTTTEGEGKIHKDKDGNPTGLFTDVNDIGIKSAEYTEEEQIEAMNLFIDDMNGWGYTAIQSIAPIFDVEYSNYTSLEESGDLTLRINAAQFMNPDSYDDDIKSLQELKKSLESDMIRVTTAKYMVDGVVEGATAYLKEPYADEEGLGKDYNSNPEWTSEQLEDAYYKVLEAGFQNHTHSIGDAATEMSLDATKVAQDKMGEGDYRATMTHLQVVDDADKPRFKELGVIASLQTFWHLKEPDWYETVDKLMLGEERAEKEYPAKSLLDAGATITNSGDFPVSPTNNPFWGIEAGVTRNLYSEEYYGEEIKDMDDPTYLLNASERLSIKDMIEAYTINGAFQLFREDEIGSLEVGKEADLIVIDKDIFAIDPIEISELVVEATLLSGNVVSGKLK